MRSVIALVVVVRRDGHDLLGELLTDDILVDLRLELMGFGDGSHHGLALLTLGLLHGCAHAKGTTTTAAREEPDGAPAAKGGIAHVAVGIVAIDGLAIDFFDLVALLVGRRTRRVIAATAVATLSRHGKAKELGHLVHLALEAGRAYGCVGRQRHKRAAGFLLGLAAEAAAP